MFSFEVSHSNSHDHLNKQVQNAECTEISVNNQPKRSCTSEPAEVAHSPNHSDSPLTKQLFRQFLRVAKH